MASVQGKNCFVAALVLCLILSAPGCKREAGNDALVEELLAADRAFSAAAAERGLEGWLDAFATDAVRLVPGNAPMQGREEFAEIDAGLFADPDLRLTWEPISGGTFKGGRLGFTIGRYLLVDRTAVADGAPVSSGSYLTLWRKDGDEWKVILDAGTANGSGLE